MQRQDVALKLEITPHINASDYVRLEIDNEISDVADPNYNNLGPATNKRTIKTVTVVRDQQKNLGELVTSGDSLLRALLQRQYTITRLLNATTEVVGKLKTLVVDDNSGLQALITNLNGLLTTLQRNDALMRNTLEILPVPLRNFTNTTGTGNEVDFSSVAGPFIDSWMCAVSEKAELVNLPKYFKDCQ